MKPEYFETLDRVKQLAPNCHMQIVPAIFPVGLLRPPAMARSQSGRRPAGADALFV